MAGFSGMVLRMVRSMATRGRIVTMFAIGGVAVLIGVLLDRSESISAQDRVDALDNFGLTVFVPLVAVVFATAALGNLVEEKTLVYFWLRPIGRWQIALAAFVATMIVPVIAVKVFQAWAKGGLALKTNAARA